MEQCSILYIRPGGREEPRVRALQSLGFHVDEVEDLPPNEAFASYHAVIVRPTTNCDLAMLATRLRAKRHFGRRALLALVPKATADRDRREATLSGFDDILFDTCGARDMAAAVLRLLRPYPEFQCVLRSPTGRRKAA